MSTPSPSPSPIPPPLPNPHRHITTTSPTTGTALFTSDPNSSLPVLTALGGGLQRLAYQTNQSTPPLSLSSDADIAHYTSTLQHHSQPSAPPPSLAPPGGGLNVWYNDIAPLGQGPVLRTETVDFVVVVSGEVELSLYSDPASSADGEGVGESQRRLVKAGDLVVQRATLHRWRNPSETRWARILAVVVEGRAVVMEEGRELGKCMLG